MGGAQALPGRHQHARLDLHHPAQPVPQPDAPRALQGRVGRSDRRSKILAAPASQDRHVELGDMQRALLHLPQPQREALILVGAGGFAYEEAAEICGCAVGTIKSRVARGRVALEQLLSSGKLPSRREHRDGSRQDGAPDDHGRSRRTQPRPRAKSRYECGRSVQPAQQLVRNRGRIGSDRRRLEGAAKRGRNAGMRRAARRRG